MPIEVAKQSYAVSLLLAASPETKHLVNKAFLDAMAPGSIPVNTSRGAIVDTEALLEAVEGVIAVSLQR